VFVTILRRGVIESHVLWDLYFTVKDHCSRCAGQLLFLEEDTLHTNIYTHIYIYDTWFNTKKLIIFPAHRTCRFCKII